MYAFYFRIGCFDDRLFKEVRRKIEKEFGQEKIDERLQWVEECLNKRDYMTVFRMDLSDSIQDIDISILQALRKGNLINSTGF